MVKNYFFASFLLSHICAFGQIKITEIYHDTPYNERMTLFNGNTQQEEDARRHHWGEFVEIYNYSDKPVRLENWFIRDLQGVFWLPSDKTIQPGEFMVIVYSAPSYNTTPFTELFNTTQGKDSQIIRQNSIIMDNYKDAIYLGYSFGREIPIDKGNHGWLVPKGSWSSNRVKGAWGQPGICYTVNSFQLTSNGSYSLASPNPLAANYVPPTQSYDDIVKDDFIKNYSFLDWTDNVNALINKICAISIEKVEQIPNGAYDSGGKCFNYDLAGNYVSSTDCTYSNSDPQNNEYSYDELQDIKNSIVLYPNPATASNSFNVTISWSGPSINKINDIKVFNSGAQLVYGITPTNGTNTTTFSLQGQLPGVFVANFMLNTGQFISKNILKW